MITNDKTNKSDAPKKNKGGGGEDDAPATVKVDRGKKAAEAEEPEEEQEAAATGKKKKVKATKKGGPAAKSAKSKKDAPKKASAKSNGDMAGPYRASSKLGTVYTRLISGKPFKSLDNLFAGLDAGDPKRMLKHIVDYGEANKVFKVKFGEDGGVQAYNIKAK